MTRSTALLIILASLPQISRATTDNDFLKASSLLHLSAPFRLTEKGKVDAANLQWKIEKDAEGTELYSTRKLPESKAAVMKDKEGLLEAVTAFTLKEKSESASAVFFKDGKLKAFTTCEDMSKESVGRVCVTATEKLCENLKKQEGITPETLKEVDLFEMRALAAILTLRGPDHQLENVVNTGNRLGLKTALQTTKGQIYSLVKQLEKEAAKKTLETVTESKESQLAKTVLEKSLPRLKDGCLAAKF